MYKEINQKNKALLHIFLIIIAGLILLTLPNYIPFGRLRSPYEIIITVTTFFCVISAVKISHCAYKYQILNNQIVIKRIWNKHEKTLINIDMENIKEFCRCKDSCLKAFKCRSAKHFCTTLGSGNDYVIVYTENGTLKKFYFEPSEQLVEILDSKLNIA